MATMSAPADDGGTIVRHLAEEPAFVGIGYATAGRLWQRFGAELYRLLGDGDAEALSEIVPLERAESLVAAWRERLAEGDVVVWLAEHGFERRLAKKVVALWGSDAVARLRSNPYVMMALADWPAVDAAAGRIGVAADSPMRLVAAAEAVLYGRYQEGHTCMGADALGAAVGKLLRCAPARAAEAVGLALRDGAAFRTGDVLQPAGAFMMERHVARQIRDMVSGPAIGDLVAREVSDAEFDEWVPGFCARAGLDLNREQREAVRIGVRERFGLVTGGAGVGKTAVLRALCEACESFGRVVHLMALAGRAAVRMREATGRPSMTIAAFLKRAEGRDIVLGPESLVVVDEASMVDLPTFYRMLRHLPDGARLLLVGDPGQLPPIGFGLVLHALVGDSRVPQVELVRVYRHTEGSGIPAVGRAVRSGALPSLPADPVAVGAGVVLVCRPAGAATEDVVDLVADLGGFGGDLRILAATKAGPVGIEALNARFHAIMAAGRPELRGFAVGEPVMFLKNDYRLDLRNGSLGTVTAIRGEMLAVDFDGAGHEFGGAGLGDLTLAYAITIHKAQGSQFRRVVVPVAPTRLLDRSLIYTALTRAVDMAVLVGPEAVLHRAVAREQAADRREVALATHLAANWG